MSIVLSAREESRMRRLARADRCPVKVVPGDSPPRCHGERGYSEFKGGGRCHHPGSAIRAGYRVVYIASTYRVEVGAGWLEREQLRERQLAVLRQLKSQRVSRGKLLRRHFSTLAPAPIVIDWLEERGERSLTIALLREEASLASRLGVPSEIASLLVPPTVTAGGAA